MEERKLEELSNNELLLKIKQYEFDYDAIKSKMFNMLDEMDEIEKKYNKANSIINKRLKGEK